MKVCPTCGKSFDDATLTCPVDGAVLIAGSATTEDSPTGGATFSSESRRMESGQYNDLLGKPTVSASHDQIPELQQYLASKDPQTQPRQRKAWPWVVAGLVVLFIVIVVIIGIAGVISVK